MAVEVFPEISSRWKPRSVIHGDFEVVGGMVMAHVWLPYVCVKLNKPIPNRGMARFNVCIGTEPVVLQCPHSNIDRPKLLILDQVGDLSALGFSKTQREEPTERGGLLSSGQWRSRHRRVSEILTIPIINTT
jgi:hypothetical protein